jgi:hypothetical protein
MVGSGRAAGGSDSPQGDDHPGAFGWPRVGENWCHKGGLVRRASRACPSGEGLTVAGIVNVPPWTAGAMAGLRAAAMRGMLAVHVHAHFDLTKFPPFRM